MSLESSSDTVVNTLRLSPAWVDTFVGVALMSVETLGAYTIEMSTPAHPNMSPASLKFNIAIPFFEILARGISRSRGGWDQRTLLDDRDVLLCGNHLEQLSENQSIGGIKLHSFPWRSAVPCRRVGRGVVD